LAATTVSDLEARTDAAWANLVRKLQGMEPHLERSDAPGEWTTREVLSHLLFEPGWERRRMSLAQLVGALDAQRRAVQGYLPSLPEGELTGRKARIPVSLAVFVGAMFGAHWNDHAGQLAEIRKAVGVPEAA